MEILKDRKIIERILNKSIESILPSKEYLEKLLLSGKRLRIYQGFDPTAPTLHIGHTVGMRKLEDFRKLGHEVIMLIGDFTGRIGDPSDKTSARQQLTSEQVNKNLQLYVKQASNILDINNKENPVLVKYNADWLEKLNFADILGLASQFSVQQMLKREMFQKRLEADKPIYIHEFMYPLMQGYDSVAMDVDIEVGGNDQLFNMLAGRDMVKNMLGKEKIVVSGKLLATSDGVKMGKSEGNMIMLSDTPENIFGKVMAFSDDQIVNAFELLTDYELDQVKDVEKQLNDGINPMDIKKILAFEITKGIHGESGAQKGKDFFEKVHQQKSFDTQIPEREINAKEISIVDLLVELAISSSKAQARRLIEQGAVSVDQERVTDWRMDIQPKGKIIKTGKKIYKII